MKPQPPSFRKAWTFFLRAMLLRCPTCGKSPLFIPIKKIRKLRDWFTPLDGCPRCGYAYEREPGYFLMATWAITYGVGSLLGIIIYLILEYKYDLPISTLLGWVMCPIIFFNIFFTRHSKSLFLAIDHFCDPHEKEEGSDDDGDLPLQPSPPSTPGGELRSLPEEKESYTSDATSASKHLISSASR